MITEKDIAEVLKTFTDMACEVGLLQELEAVCDLARTQLKSRQAPRIYPPTSKQED